MFFGQIIPLILFILIQDSLHYIYIENVVMITYSDNFTDKSRFTESLFIFYHESYEEKNFEPVLIFLTGLSVDKVS
jgi:hypothetical protein